MPRVITLVDSTRIVESDNCRARSASRRPGGALSEPQGRQALYRVEEFQPSPSRLVPDPASAALDAFHAIGAASVTSRDQHDRRNQRSTTR
jgi:hypothetical protein